MIGPSANEITAMRWRVQVVLRVLAVLMFLIALGMAIARVPEFRYQSLFYGQGSRSTPRFLGVDWFLVPIVMVAGSLVIVLVSKLGMGLLVPLPRQGCPGCGYDLSEPASDRCPECGLRIGDAPTRDQPTESE